MRSTKLLAITIVTLGLTGITATLAQAAATLPNYLPQAGPGAAEIIKATSTSGTSSFGSSALEVTSAKSKGTLEGNSLKLGSLQATLEETGNKLTGAKCTGLSAADGTGILLVQGTFHIRHYNEGTLKTAAIVLLVPTHFSCGTLLLIVLGCVASELTPQNMLTKTLTTTFAKGTGNDNKVITILKEELNGEEACQLLFATGGGFTFALASFTSSETIRNFTQNGAEITILVMPL